MYAEVYANIYKAFYQFIGGKSISDKKYSVLQEELSRNRTEKKIRKRFKRREKVEFHLNANLEFANFMIIWNSRNFYKQRFFSTQPQS